MAFNTYTEQLDSLYTTTWQLRKSEIFDQVFTSTPLFMLLTEKGRVEKETGGTVITEPLNYAKNETVQFIGKGDTVSIVSSDTLTETRWDWKILTGLIVRYFSDTQKNRGKAALIKRVNADIDTLTGSLIDLLETEMFDDGTNFDGKTIGGLQLLVADAPATGVVANIDRANYPWWRNQFDDFTGTISVDLIDDMEAMYNTCSKYKGRGRKSPDLIVTTQAIYQFYSAEAREIGQVMMPHKGVMDLGMGDLAFMGANMTWSPDCPSGKMYFLNTDNLRLVVDDIAWLTLGKWLDIITQPGDAVAHSLTVCNMTMSNARKQGVIFGID